MSSAPRRPRRQATRRGPCWRGLVLLAALPAAVSRPAQLNPPGCGDFKKGDGTAAPTCGNKSEFACGPDKKPLGFIHIPKTAGTTIESLGRDHGVRWGRFHKSRDPMSVCVDHEVFPGGNDYVAVHPPFSSIPATLTHFAAGTLAVCAWCHIPPHRVHDEYNPYDEGENFCVLRNPYKKFVSDYTFLFCYDNYKDNYENGDMGMAGFFDIPECSPEGLNHFLQVMIKRYMSKNPLYMFNGDCHFLPQYDFAFGPDGRQWCHHQLKFEELPHNFNSFMEKQGLPMRMSGSENPSSCATRKCNVTVNDLTPETRALIEEAYSKDFKLGGYALMGNAAAKDP